jgi:hypothetical protein
MFLLNGNKLKIYNTLNMVRVNITKKAKINETLTTQNI